MSDARPNSGLLFKNFRKKQPKHPDYTGTCEVNGVKMEISAWEKPLRSGKGTFLSLSFQPPRTSDTGLPTADAPGEEKPTQESTESEPKKGNIPF